MASWAAPTGKFQLVLPPTAVKHPGCWKRETMQVDLSVQEPSRLHKRIVFSRMPLNKEECQRSVATQPTSRKAFFLLYFASSCLLLSTAPVASSFRLPLLYITAQWNSRNHRSRLREYQYTLDMPCSTWKTRKLWKCFSFMSTEIRRWIGWRDDISAQRERAEVGPSRRSLSLFFCLARRWQDKVSSNFVSLVVLSRSLFFLSLSYLLIPCSLVSIYKHE